MKKFTYRLGTLIVAGALFAFVGCSKEEFSETQIVEDITVENTGQKRNCGTCSSSKYPGKYTTFKAALEKMDLEHKWNGGSSSDNHSNPHTSGACDTDFFTVCGSNNQMVMSATGGSSDRTELKTTSSDAQSMNNYSQMRLEAQIVDIPSSSSSSNNKKKGVTIAQIHNRGSSVGRPLARLDIAGYNKKVQITFAHGYRKNVDGQTTYELVDYDEGDDMYVKMKINSSGNSVYVYVKNKTKNKSGSKTYAIPSSSNWNSKNGTYYYKTGVYQQLSGDTPSISYDYLYFDSL